MTDRSEFKTSLTVSTLKMSLFVLYQFGEILKLSGFGSFNLSITVFVRFFDRKRIKSEFLAISGFRTSLTTCQVKMGHLYYTNLEKY